MTGRAALGVRTLAALRLLGGAALAARPQDVARRSAGRGEAPAPAWLVRALGCRLVVQGVLELASPSRRVVLGGALVDLTHAATMLGLAKTWPDRRRAALLSGGVGLGCAVLNCAVANLAEGARSSNG